MAFDPQIGRETSQEAVAVVKIMVVESADTIPLSDIEIYALTLLGEARGLGAAGMTEVAAVVQNRIAANKWWGHDERSVCLYPWQFSCWNDNDPNRHKLLQWPVNEPIYLEACHIAVSAMAGSSDDLTHGAVSYYNHLTIKTPKWAIGKTPCHINGPILFFDLAAIA